MFSHGTLMFDSEIENVVSALKVKAEKIQSKGIKSIRSRVANISEFLNEKISMDEFKNLLLRYIFDVEDVKDVPTYELTEQDWDNIHQLSKERYQNWDWNYGKSPKFNIQQSHKFDAGLVDVRLDVINGMIENCKIFGDFFGVGEVSDIEDRLIGIRHERKAIEEALTDVDMKHYIGNISKEDFIDLVY
jgi:lipoate-protein ligase A